MKKTIIFLLIICVNIVYSQSKIYAFIGKKISVERVKPDDHFYLKYRNVYKVEQVFDNEIKTDTIIFNSYTHMNQIGYSVYDYAIIYLMKNNSGNFIQKRTYYTPIILNKDGKWYGFDRSDETIQDYESITAKNLHISKNLKTAKVVYPELKKRKYLIKAFYPSLFFNYVNKNSIEIKNLKTAENLYKEKVKEIFSKKN
ncbi:hypothetical protein NAL32_13305 [Chryseobacterium sp. Ch-15]|uniref:Uncharacterized protein n=1 Tax=Chryseobacterium muglaense TaxID=2893752 RepID=A0A9Q3UXK6_9FLAO|nr:hypothetical protein [Chryseobacterium muglaense]MBD3905490.1 hypothetical protein [Chryseobacterium muglaense]MCC9036437.1 hypothetical protein [Chryseobacterium muglaense]MCM2555362.1 hypothetical protein [Chryseobacterium muglaense]